MSCLSMIPSLATLAQELNSKRETVIHENVNEDALNPALPHSPEASLPFFSAYASAGADGDNVLEQTQKTIRTSELVFCTESASMVQQELQEYQNDVIVVDKSLVRLRERINRK